MGKEVGDDLAEGKVTLPLIYALQNANPKDKEFLIKAIDDKDNSNISKIIEVLEKTNAFELSLNDAKKCVKNAKNDLDF